jgi:hypothetical protein
MSCGNCLPAVVYFCRFNNSNNMINLPKPNNKGQALIEYLLIFSFVTFLSINIVKGMSKTMLSSVGYMGYELTEQFTVGVCKKLCFFNGYLNQEQ